MRNFIDHARLTHSHLYKCSGSNSSSRYPQALTTDAARAYSFICNAMTDVICSARDILSLTRVACFVMQFLPKKMCMCVFMSKCLLHATVNQRRTTADNDFMPHDFFDFQKYRATNRTQKDII